MNFTLAKEIYGNPWFMDAYSIQSMTALLKHFRSGGSFNADKKSNSFGYLDMKSSEIIDDISKLSKTASNNNISIINMDGPITKGGGMSHNGTIEMAAMLREFDASDKIIGHILMINSGGGSVNAIAEIAEAMTDASKPIVAYVDDTMASAALYIGSYADFIISRRATDRIGSIGTMIELSGYKKVDKKSTGETVVRIYADDSTDKNEEFEAAINDLNFKPIKDNVLNPHLEQFKKDVKTNRPNILDSQLTGKVYKASEVVGTLIDQIGSFQDAINKVIELSTFDSSINNNPKTKKMTQQELKANHPDVYGQILAEGVTSEQNRVKAWMAFQEVDPKAVSEGITSGKPVDNLVIAEMSAKAISNAQAAAIAAGNPKAIEVAKEQKEKTAEELEADAELKAFQEAVNASANIKIKEV